ncbi:hypothetical protein ACHAXT_007209 [Thalassiosira profunda]
MRLLALLSTLLVGASGVIYDDGQIHSLALLSTLLVGASGVIYDDGQSHSLDGQSLDEPISLRSSSKLTLPSGDYAIRAPAGGDAAIRLYMSSFLNATGGDIMGADAADVHPVAGAGVIVGGASRAVFSDGATVRGGNRPGADDNSGGGGDAIISQYYASNVTIYGGTFLAGKGGTSDGHSLRASYEAEIYVHGGSFYGAWVASHQGSIVVTGCVSRIGTRLVGRLEDGHSLDVQTQEEAGGKITAIRDPEICNHYRKKPSSSAVKTAGVGTTLAHLWCGIAMLRCLR